MKKLKVGDRVRVYWSDGQTTKGTVTRVHGTHAYLKDGSFFHIDDCNKLRKKQKEFHMTQIFNCFFCSNIIKHDYRKLSSEKDPIFFDSSLVECSECNQQFKLNNSLYKV